jgi:hypothetical protein
VRHAAIEGSPLLSNHFSLHNTTMASLSRILKEIGPVDLQIDYIGPESDIPKKGGGSYRGHKLILKNRATGKTYEDKLFPNQTAFFKTGMLIRADLDGKGYVAYSKVNADEERNNYKDVQTERKMAPVNAHLDNLQRAKEIQICLQGLLQAHITAGQPNEIAMKMAVEARDLLLVEVKNILSKDE